MKKQVFILVLLFINTLSFAQNLSGELKKWHKITIDFEGPMTYELGQPNPFTYYRLDMTFTHESGAPVLVVPAYYAADGKAANTSATKGNIWRVHFTPEKTGKWAYQILCFPFCQGA